MVGDIAMLGPPGWYIAVQAVPPEILGLSPGSVAAGCDREVHGATHNWPSIVRVREGLAGRDILVSSCTSDSCGGPGVVHADHVARCTVFPTKHWCAWLLGWMCIVSRQHVLNDNCSGDGSDFSVFMLRAR